MFTDFCYHRVSRGEEFSLPTRIEFTPYLELCMQGRVQLSTVVPVTRYWIPVTGISAVESGR
jgi:hypothetical protein